MSQPSYQTLLGHIIHGEVFTPLPWSIITFITSNHSIWRVTTSAPSWDWVVPTRSSTLNVILLLDILCHLSSRSSGLVSWGVVMVIIPLHLGAMMLVLRAACITSMTQSSGGITFPQLPSPCSKDPTPWLITNSPTCSALTNCPKWSLKFYIVWSCAPSHYGKCNRGFGSSLLGHHSSSLANQRRIHAWSS